MPQDQQTDTKKRVTLEDLAMMTANGLDEIKTEIIEVKEELKKRPTLEQIDLKFQSFRTQIDLKLTNMENRLTENLGGKPMSRDRVLNTKTDTVAKKLGDKLVFSSDDVRDIEHISPFAVNPLHQ